MIFGENDWVYWIFSPSQQFDLLSLGRRCPGGAIAFSILSGTASTIFLFGIPALEQGVPCFLDPCRSHVVAVLHCMVDVLVRFALNSCNYSWSTSSVARPIRVIQFNPHFRTDKEVGDHQLHNY